MQGRHRASGSWRRKIRLRAASGRHRKNRATTGNPFQLRNRFLVVLDAPVDLAAPFRHGPDEQAPR